MTTLAVGVALIVVWVVATATRRRQRRARRALSVLRNREAKRQTSAKYRRVFGRM